MCRSLEFRISLPRLVTVRLLFELAKLLAKGDNNDNKGRDRGAAESAVVPFFLPSFLPSSIFESIHLIL